MIQIIVDGLLRNSKSRTGESSMQSIDRGIETLYGQFVTISRGTIREWIPKAEKALLDHCNPPKLHKFIYKRAWGSESGRLVRCLDVGLLWRVKDD